MTRRSLQRFRSARVVSAALVALVLAMAPTHARAQTQSLRLQWFQPLATGQAFTDAQGWTYTVKIDAAAPVLLTATCVDGQPIICTAPIAPLVSGTHTLTLTAANAFGSATSAPLTGAPPGTPATVKITITVTIP